MNSRLPIIRIATRQSPLALAQAELVKAALLNCDPALAITILPMLTSGDTNPQAAFREFGLKGAFTREIELMLLSGDADIAVHSMKDMPTELPERLTIAAMLPRDDARDAFISLQHESIAAMPPGSKLGTSSVRRTALVRHHYPHLALVPFRGNVNTRLTKLAEHHADGTLLAAAGLKRLGLAERITEILAPDHFIPAVAQGAIGIECHAENDAMLQWLTRISHPETMQAVAAERALLHTLDGSCHTPICGYAQLQGGRLNLDAALLAPDGSAMLRASRQGLVADARTLGIEAGKELLALADPSWLAH